MGVARWDGGGGAGRSNLTLPPCGQLTRCFSAVAELLVYILHLLRIKVLYIITTHFVVVLILVLVGLTLFKKAAMTLFHEKA